MLDEISLTLLAIIDGQCAQNGYRVFDFEEIVKFLPSHLKVDTSIIKESLVSLNASGYISIKYQDEVEVCLSSLPKGRQLLERQRLDKQTLQEFKRIHLKNSLLGGFLGGLVTGILFVIIFVVLGV